MTDPHGARAVARFHGCMDREAGRPYQDDTAADGSGERAAAYAAGYREGYQGNGGNSGGNR